MKIESAGSHGMKGTLNVDTSSDVGWRFKQIIVKKVKINNVKRAEIARKFPSTILSNSFAIKRQVKALESVKIPTKIATILDVSFVGTEI